jgi:activator of HSP90 ATPase
MTYEFTLTIRLSATPQQIFDSWLSAEGHTAMTGGVAHVTPHIGDDFDAWDGYITGRNIQLEPDKRIVQTWRTRHFLPQDADSLIEVLLEPDGDATKLTLNHSNVPADQKSYEESGWQKHYFEPMQRRMAWLAFVSAMQD